jgi:dienelactone hydrolase
MRFTSETISDGVTERPFILDDIPGVLWSPAGDAAGRPLVLIGHGGGQHKQAQGVVARARRFVTNCGFAVAAIDAPGHAGRPKTERDERFIADIRPRMAAGEPVGPRVADYNAELAERAVPEWRATLDALVAGAGLGGPTGYLGLSLGGGIGVPLAVAEPRIGAAVFGLVGAFGPANGSGTAGGSWTAGPEPLARTAARVTVPVEFLLQWDDQLIPREAGLALFDAFGSAEKTLHANPGPHGGVPLFEAASSERFFVRHLGLS